MGLSFMEKAWLVDMGIDKVVVGLFGAINIGLLLVKEEVESDMKSQS